MIPRIWQTFTCEAERAEALARELGVSEIMAPTMRTGGTKAKTGDELDVALEDMASSVESSMGETSASVSFNALSENIDKTLDIFRDVLTNAQRVQASRIASRLAQKQLEAEEKKLQVGLATVFTTLQFQDVLSQQRSNEINAITEYLKALVRLEESKNTLLQSYNIVLQADGPRLQQ